MPTYTYRCTNCEHQFETRQRMIDDPLTECPQCEGKIRRVVNSVGVVFKGKGFYVTDNRGKKSQAPSNKKESTTTKESSTKSSESKTSSSSENKSSKTEKSNSPA